jgi:hypothetical protein
MSSRPPIRRFLRFVSRLGVVFLVLGVAAFLALRSDAFSRFVAKALEVAIEQATGDNAVVGSVEVRPLRRRVELAGLVISDPAAPPGQPPMALVESASVTLGLDGFDPVLKTLALERPRITLHLVEGKIAELHATPRATEPTAGKKFPWRRLTIHDGAFSLLTPDGNAIELTGVDVETASEGTMDVVLERVAVTAGKVKEEATNIRFPDVSATPERILVPSIDLTFQRFSVTGSFGLIAGQAIALDLFVKTELARWSDLMGGSTRAEGSVMCDIGVRGPPKAPEVSGALLVQWPKLFVTNVKGAERAYELGEITAAWKLAGRQIDVDPLVAHWAGGLIEVHGSVDLETKILQAAVTAENLGFAQIMRATAAAPNPWVDFTGDAEAQIAGQLSPLDLYGSFDLAIANLLVEEGPVDEENDRVLEFAAADASGQLHLDAQGIRLEAWEAGTRSTRGHVVADIGFGYVGPLGIDLDMAVDYSEIRPLGGVGLEGIGHMKGRIAGPFNDLHVTATADAANFAVLQTRFADAMTATLSSDMKVLTLDSFQARKGETVYAGTLAIDLPHESAIDLQILIDHGRLSDIVGMWLEIPGLEAALPGGRLWLKGEPFHLDGEAEIPFGEIDLFGEHFERGVARGTMKNGRFTLDDLRITRADGKQSIVARGTVKEQWRSHFEVVSGGLTLETSTLFANAADMQGKVHLDLVVDGTLFVPAPRGRIALSDTQLFDRPLEATTLYFDTDERGVLAFEGGVLGASMGVQGTLHLWEEQAYQVTLDLGGYPVGAFFPLRDNAADVRAQAWGGVTMSGAFGDHPTPVDIVAEISRFEAEWEGHRLESKGPWHYEQHGTAFTLRDLTFEGGATAIQFSGSRTAQGAVDFTGGGALDLDLLRLVVPGLELSEGTATVEVSFRGAPKKVDSHVLVKSSGARFEGDWFPAELEDVDFTVRATPVRYDIETRGRFGGGVFEVGGTIGAEGWTPKRYELTGNATDATLRWFDFLPPARGDAQLTFRGPADSLLLAGHVDITSMVFSERISWESFILELEQGRLQGASSVEVGEPLFAMNVDIVANETIRAHNNVAELDASANLRLVGDTERPGLLGDVRALPGGKVLFKEREFDLERGEIRFLDPYSFDPELDFALVTDVRTREQDYTIDLWVTGPFSDWRSTASSDPALSQADINAVLLFGMTGEEFERYGGIASAVALEGGGLLLTKAAGDLGLANQSGQGIFQLEALRPDRVDIETGVGKRAMGSVTTGARLVVEKDVDIEGWPEGTFVIEQNIVDLEDTYVGFEQRLARRLYATGYWATQPIGRDITVLGAFGAEFNYRWEFD